MDRASGIFSIALLHKIISHIIITAERKGASDGRMKLEEGTSHHTVNSGSLNDGQCILFHLPPVWGPHFFPLTSTEKITFLSRLRCGLLSDIRVLVVGRIAAPNGFLAEFLSSGKAIKHNNIISFQQPHLQYIVLLGSPALALIDSLKLWL